MSRETIIVLHDDLDGGEADDTVTFAFDGVTYEIDLNKHNIDVFRKTMQPYVDAGRRTKGRSTPKKSTAGKQSPATVTPVGNGQSGVVPGHSAREVRDWARTNNLDVPERGRIPQEVADAFMTAHGMAQAS